MIELVAQKTGGSIRMVCAVLGEARSSFYHAATPTATQVADVEIGNLKPASDAIGGATATAVSPRNTLIAACSVLRPGSGESWPREPCTPSSRKPSCQ